MLFLSILGIAYLGSVVGYSMGRGGDEGLAAFVWPVVEYIKSRKSRNE